MSWTVGLPVFATDAGRSGLSVYTQQLALAMLQADPSLRLEVVGPREQIEPLNLEPHPRVRVQPTGGWTRTRPGDWWWHQQRLERWARTNNVDVVLFPAGNRRLQPLRGIPTVATIHDLGELVIPDKYGSLRRWRVKNVILPAMEQVTKVITISEASREAIVMATRLEAGQVPVIPNGVHPRFAPTCKKRARRRLRARFDLQRPFFLYVARLEHPAKNHVRLLEAFASRGLQATHDLVLVGADWPGCEIVYRTIERLGLREAVRRPGFVPDAFMPDLYRAATALTFVSRFEGFGLPLIEAQACGCPLVFSDREPMRGLAGSAGLPVDPECERSIGAALQRLSEDARLRARLSAEGRERSTRWSWSRTAEETLDVLRSARAKERATARVLARAG